MKLVDLRGWKDVSVKMGEYYCKKNKIRVLGII
jgi:hypothetical protein